MVAEKRKRRDTLLRVRMVICEELPERLKNNMGDDNADYGSWLNKIHGKGFMLLAINPGNHIHVFGRVEVTDL